MKRALGILVVLGILGGAGYFGYVAYKKYDDQRNANKWDEIKKIEEQGPLASGEIGRLIRDMNDASVEVQLAAAIALGQMGEKAVPPLRDKLKKGSKGERFNAALALALIGPEAAPAVDELIVCASDTATDVRYKAIYALGKIDTGSPASINAIVAALDDSNLEVSQSAQEAIQAIGPAGKTPLYAALAKAQGATRGSILVAVSRLGVPPREAAALLVEIIEAPDTEMPAAAVHLLAQLGDDAVPTFKKILVGDDDGTKVRALIAFKHLGPAGKALLPEIGALLATTGDQHTAVLGADACKSFEEVGAITLAKVLADELDAKGKRSKWKSIYLWKLGEIGAPAKVAVPVLVRYLESPDPNDVNQALEALGSIGPAAREGSLPALEKMRAAYPSLGPRIDEIQRRMGVIAAKENKK